ncbi:hypothetical protein RGQ29_024218 [Quercus rubra]|uniref:BI1-like protein n=1 Tax=Quercus rubra TaxID=3512 RepID=A0AAN7IMR8_QUERU|nr:hypothetical protein RGQ29_024218 [Quercus rubra]
MTRSNKADVESGNNNQLYPMMLESPQLRWAFIRKVYSILCIQMLLTTTVAATVVFVRPIPNFFTQTAAGLAIYIVICILPFILLWPLYYYHKHHPWNFFILMLFTVSISFVVGLACAFTKERKRFQFLEPFLSASLLVLIVFGLIQIFIPLGKISVMIYSGLASLIFCGFLVYDTDDMIKRYSYDDYIWAAATLYLDVINIFLNLLNLLDAADS